MAQDDHHRLPTIRKELLANGLQLFLLQDRQSPLLTFAIWFRVGSTYEQEPRGGRTGTTGISHLLEHMLFKGTARFPDAFAEVYKRGGLINGWTWYDATCFWEKLPAGNLPLLFALEADRLRNIRFDFVQLETEREVVRNERLLRSVNDPVGALDERLHQRAFACSPYRSPVVGQPRDLIAIRREQVLKHFHTYYNPANAFLVVVGDFDPDEALRLAESEFGQLPAFIPPPRPSATEPEQAAERRDFLEKSTSSGLLLMAFTAPAAADPEFTVFEVLHSLLGRGKSSRLQRRLVAGSDPVATQVSATLWAMQSAYLYQLEIHLVPGRSTREAEQRVEEVLDEVCSQLIPITELRKAVAGLQAEEVRTCLETQGKANMIGFSVIATGEPETLLRRLGQLRQVTAAEILQTAQRYLIPSRRTVVTALNPSRLREEAATIWPPPLRSESKELELLQRSLELEWASHELGLERAVLEEEEEAIRGLEQRAAEEQARLEQEALDPDRTETARLALIELEQFLVAGQKGVAQRRTRTLRQQEQLTERVQEQARHRSLLLTEIESCGKAASAPENSRSGTARNQLLLELALVVLGELPFPELGRLELILGAAEGMLLLVLRALRLHRSQLATTEANQLANRVLELERALSKRADLPDEERQTCRRLADLAWELRVY